MDRVMIAQYLAQAEHHISDGERNLARQRELVAELERDGCDATMAADTLAQFAQIQALHIADRDRLRRKLAKTP
jgi:hypothetical protein